jgi:hypothetical protein
MHPKLLVLFMWKVGYFRRNDGVMSLFQVSKELHLKGVDILRADIFVLECLLRRQVRAYVALA